MIKIHKNLFVFSGLLLFLGALLLFILQKFSPLVGHVTYYCQSLIDTYMIPIPYYLSIIPVLFLAGILAVSFIKFLILNVKVQFLKYILKDKITTGKKVNKLIKNLGLQGKTVVVKSNETFAFCIGISTPKIYISTRLIAKLSAKELEAVLRHEQYHLENYDTLTSIIASFAHSLSPIFPLLGDLIKKYRIDREIAADKFAVRHIGNSYPLISALKKLLAFETPQAVAFAAIADEGTLEPRICSLVNKQYKMKFSASHIFITLFFALLIGFIAITPVHAKELHHQGHDVMMLCTNGECMNSCTSEQNLNKLYSEIPDTKKSDNNAYQSYTPIH